MSYGVGDVFGGISSVKRIDKGGREGVLHLTRSDNTTLSFEHTEQTNLLFWRCSKRTCQLSFMARHLARHLAKRTSKASCTSSYAGLQGVGLAAIVPRDKALELTSVFLRSTSCLAGRLIRRNPWMEFTFLYTFPSYDVSKYTLVPNWPSRTAPSLARWFCTDGLISTRSLPDHHSSNNQFRCPHQPALETAYELVE